MGEKLWKKFNAPPEKKLWYYKEAVKIIAKRVDGKIARELKTVYGEALEIFEKNQNVFPDKNNRVERLKIIQKIKKELFNKKV